MTYWDRDPVPRNMRERELESRLIREWYERPNVLSIRRQYRVNGNERADLVVLQGSDDYRHITIIEVKAGTAGLVALSQVLRYWRYIRRDADADTIVHCVIAAPAFQKQLRDWMEAVDPFYLRLEQVSA